MDASQNNYADLKKAKPKQTKILYDSISLNIGNVN